MMVLIFFKRDNLKIIIILKYVKSFSQATIHCFWNTVSIIKITIFSEFLYLYKAYNKFEIN